ncbi:MAG: glycosyltransferase family 39 protein [Opitutales bacterium]|nr:glycosyltransferase family 39 protein [Opitutales bacterium]
MYKILRLLVVAGALFYGFAYLDWYWGTALGQSPHLDGEETLVLAGQIVDGGFSNEPFYRAMLYQGVLAGFRVAGVPQSELAHVAGLFGLLCHALSAFLVGNIAKRLWDNEGAAVLASLLYALYPVSIYFMADPLDTTFSITLCLLGIDRLMAKEKAYNYLLGGIFLGLAICARPHFLTVLVVAPIALLFTAEHFHKGVVHASLLCLGALMILGSYGMVNYLYSGSFKVLPWQGDFNFYAANKHGSNGKYYKQDYFITQLNPGENPARKASELQYEEETGKKPPYSVEQITDYFKRKGRNEVKGDPAHFIRLMSKKTVYLFNNFEQYNNKTYSFHKAMSPLLKPNVLCWSLILGFAVCGLAVGREQFSRKHAALILMICAYSGGMLLYYASARFRLPLVPMLCVFSGGVLLVEVEKLWTNIGLGVLGIGLTWFVSAPNWAEAQDRKTEAQDIYLVANAYAKLGNDAEALEWSLKALEPRPERMDARRVATISFYNLQMLHALKKEPLLPWSKLLTYLYPLSDKDSAVMSAQGLILWNSGKQGDALVLWNKSLAVNQSEGATSLAFLLVLEKDPLNALPFALNVQQMSGNKLLDAAIHGRIGDATPDQKLLFDAITYLLSTDVQHISGATELESETIAEPDADKH